jgi:hypothetical protein
MLCSYKAPKPCEITGSSSGVVEISSFLICYIMVTAKELLFELHDPQGKDYDPFELQ